jgi:serine/threonine protein kinase
LCDFGLSRIRYEISRTYTTVHQGGHGRFLAPEIYKAEDDTRINESSDIYSLAMTIYALGTRSLPFAGLKNWAACSAAARGERPSKRNSLGGLMTDDSELLWSLMERMWDGRPEIRPTISCVRNEIMKSSLMRLEPTTVPIVASSRSAQHSAPAFLQHADSSPPQGLAVADKDEQISEPLSHRCVGYGTASMLVWTLTPVTILVRVHKTVLYKCN